jgi:hypothetical protein
MLSFSEALTRAEREIKQNSSVYRDVTGAQVFTAAIVLMFSQLRKHGGGCEEGRGVGPFARNSATWNG